MDTQVLMLQKLLQGISDVSRLALACHIQGNINMASFAYAAIAAVQHIGLLLEVKRKSKFLGDANPMNKQWPVGMPIRNDVGQCIALNSL
jgi:hypothetical protein